MSTSRIVYLTDTNYQVVSEKTGYGTATLMEVLANYYKNGGTKPASIPIRSRARKKL